MTKETLRDETQDKLLWGLLWLDSDLGFPFRLTWSSFSKNLLGQFSENLPPLVYDRHGYMIKFLIHPLDILSSQPAFSKNPIKLVRILLILDDSS